MSSSHIKAVLARFEQLREDKGITTGQIEEKLILGPGWIERFERGDSIPSMDMLFAMLQCIDVSMDQLLSGLDLGDAPSEIERYIFAEPNGKNLDIFFQYANHDAIYGLINATSEQFESVIKILRDHLSLLAADEASEKALKTEAVASAFLKSVGLWPHANPSDLWYFIIYRAFCDPFNHPAQFARMSFEQSWKRTGGWALEQVLVRHYGDVLAKNGIDIVIGTSEEKQRYLRGVKNVTSRLEADKADVLLLGEHNGEMHFFGVVHVKASFAERRTDDVPMSKALVDAGYISPLWTMDCKSTPSERPENRGELGETLSGNYDGRSAKRKDIEDDGFFSACFSYNRRTKPTPTTQKVKGGSVYVCDFANPDDAFSRFIIKGWQSFPHK